MCVVCVTVCVRVCVCGVCDGVCVRGVCACVCMCMSVIPRSSASTDFQSHRIMPISGRG